MYEDLYFWRKNGRPDIEKDHDFNAGCHMKMRYIETNLVLLKTYHMDFGEGQCSKKRQEELDRTVFSQDIQPYVQYSLNKKKRWEVEAAVKMLGELQKMYNDMDVVVLERIDFRGAPFFTGLRFPDNYFEKFRIQKMHKILDDKYYQCTAVDSVHGQKFNDIQFKNRSLNKSKDLEAETMTSKIAGRPIVAYHLIKPHQIYEKKVAKYFNPCSTKKKNWYYSELYSVDWYQLITEDTYEAITYDALEDHEWDELHEWEEEEDTGSISVAVSEKCYNLEDHLVDKYVMVKRKKA
ncbi:DUF4130 domain-containing protein [Caenorhabditis elegans]|uniref:DUF4130 domain-containing protein n=1 Tax=Caenorhabditis elegans TaxID=6239 RepID=Q9N5I0_CAEEL|nr:DUF4130 domain-containing protein [Caenorhabditis elegans]CCD61369.2 DUF4130 domain-containing protein [Caenorhabditis elegans]|eukprot:NP_504122.2 Uncharacterized protein CELE_K09D9.1 [Caenorhabditis elegans]